MTKEKSGIRCIIKVKGYDDVIVTFSASPGMERNIQSAIDEFAELHRGQHVVRTSNGYEFSPSSYLEVQKAIYNELK